VERHTARRIRHCGCAPEIGCDRRVLADIAPGERIEVPHPIARTFRRQIIKTVLGGAWRTAPDREFIPPGAGFGDGYDGSDVVPCRGCEIKRRSTREFRRTPGEPGHIRAPGGGHPGRGSPVRFERCLRGFPSEPRRDVCSEVGCLEGDGQFVTSRANSQSSGSARVS